MTLEVAVHVVIDGLNALMGAYVLFKNPRSITHRAFFIFAFGIVTWSVGMLFVFFVGTFFSITVALWGGEMVVLGFIIFAKSFPDHDTLPWNANRKFFFALFPLGALFLASPFHLILTNAARNGKGYLEPENGPLFPVFAAVLACYIGWGLWELLRKYRLREGVARVQLRYVIGGAGTFLGGAFIFDVLLPAFHIFTLNLLGPVCSAIFIACASYAIVRHELMDIKVIIKKGVTYALVVLTIVIIFIGIEFFIEKTLDPNDEVVDIFAAAVGALAFSDLRNVFARVTDRMFFRGEYDYAKSVQKFATLTGSTIDLEKLLAAIADFLMRTVKPSQIMIFLPSNEGIISFGLSHDARSSPRKDECELFAREALAAFRVPTFFQEKQREEGYAVPAKRLGVAAVVPFIANARTQGIMLLGEKMSDDIYRAKDIDLMRVIAHHAGIAIENARLYEEAKRHNEELEMRVEERTEKMRLMQEAQSKFLTDVSHELQTPVAILKGNMEIMERKRTGDRKTALRVMGSTIGHLAQMVDHLLAGARLNFSKTKLYKEQFVVDNLLEEIYYDCSALAEDKGVVLSYGAGEPTPLFADREKMKAVILNLVSNALKHTPQGGTIALASSRMRERVTIMVRDTGSGIAPEDMSMIFERFYRIEGDPATGTGLGLDIVKKIVEAHAGIITVESELGRGSCFTISLPVDAP